MMPSKMQIFVAPCLLIPVMNFQQLLGFGLSLYQLISFPVASAPILHQQNRILVVENYIVEIVTTFQDALLELQTVGFVDIAN